MPGPGDVILVLDSLELELLDKDWVRSIWTEKFGSCPEALPDEYSEKFSLLNAEDTIEVLKQGPLVIKSWLDSDSTSRIDGSATIANWTALQDVPYQNLLALLYFYTSHGFDRRENKSCIELGIKSAEMYFSLLTIPGSNVYNIFEVSLYESCLKMFSIAKFLNKISPEVKNKNNRNNITDDECSEEMTAVEERSVLKSINHLLIEFKSFVQLFSFKNQLEALSLSLTYITELTRCERFVSLDEFLRCNDKNTFTLLSKNAYLTLKELCASMHGRDVVRLVLYHLMPNFSLIGGSSYPEIAKWSSKEHTVMRSLAFWFLKTHLIGMGDSVYSSIRILIENLSHNTVDRAEYRAKSTDLSINIISLLPEKPYYSILKWIFLEAFYDNASQRVVALELLSKLIFLKQGSAEMSNMADSGRSSLPNSSRSHLDPSQNSVELSNHPSSINSNDINTDATVATDSSMGQARIISFCKPIEYVPIEYRRMMLAIIIDRCQDSAATVRTKAFSALSEIISNQTSPTIKKLVASIFVDPYQALSDIQVGSQEAEFLSCTDFRSALERPNWSAVNETMIPGATRIVLMVIKRCVDEKVHVRKSSLALLANIFKLNPQWMTKTNLQHFGQHCRDPALSIRKDMLNMVTDLMLYYPNHPALSRIWVQEVVPQVADREIRVQESALNVLTRTILANIKPLHQTLSNTDALPWQLLSQIASLKNRIFLTKACQLWRDSKTPELNENRIQSVISHIGSAQNDSCWVMLASYSEYNDIAKAQPIMDHYLSVVAKGDCDLSVANLVLVTLNNCCHKLSRESKVLLENEVLESLKNPATSPCMVSLLVKIRANLRHLLSENEAQAKRELSKWTVETVEDGEKQVEDILECEGRVWPPEGKNIEELWPRCLYYLTLIGSLSDLHPNQIRESTVKCILRFLGSKTSMTHEGLVKLQASAIVTLGRISLKVQSTANSFVQCLTGLLTHCRNPTILNNVVVSIADVGERYPNLIEPFISSLSMCLKHRNREVRKTSLEITIDLLQEDYVKARGALIFNLMTLILDPVRHTSSTVKAYLTNCYFPKITSPENVLLQAMFHYNRFKGHHSYNRIEVSPGEALVFNLSGPRMHLRRLAIYRFLLSRVNFAHRFRCFQQIGEAILSDVALTNINVQTLEGEQLLMDTFGLLLGGNMKVDAAKKKGEEEEEGEEPDRVADAKANEASAYTAIILKLVASKCSAVRKTLFQQRRKNNLHKLMYFFAREMFRDHRASIAELFKDDRQFGEELRYEIENYPKADWDEEMMIALENRNPVEPEQGETENANISRKRKSDEHLPDDEIKKRSKENTEGIVPSIVITEPQNKEDVREGGSNSAEEEVGDQQSDEQMIVENSSESIQLASKNQVFVKITRLPENVVSLIERRTESSDSDKSVDEGIGESSQKSNGARGRNMPRQRSVTLTQIPRSVRSSGRLTKQGSLQAKEKCDDKKLDDTNQISYDIPSISNITSGSQNSSRPPSRNSEEGGVDKSGGGLGKKRRIRRASDNLDDNDIVGIMLPPSRPNRISRKNTSTPIVPSRSRHAPPFSSTPLVAKPKSFDATDISPVPTNSTTDEA